MNDYSNTNYLNFVESKFNQCFSNKKYYEEIPVDITSKIDATTDFIGSTISPLKKYVIENNIPKDGIFLIQNCMKSKSLKYLKDYTPQKFGCYFKCMGILTTTHLQKTVFDTFDYLINYIKIDPADMCIRICSQDKDLIEAIEYVDKDIKREVDTVDLKHYRHKYGMDDQQITGRDFNIAIRKKGTNEYFNCAAFVIMENKYEKLAVDMAIGNCSLSLCKFGYNSTISSSRMGDILNIKTIADEKFADALIAVSILLKENILQHPSKHFRYKFKRYLNILMYWNQQYNYSSEELTKMIINFLELEYNNNYDYQNENWVKILEKNRIK